MNIFIKHILKKILIANFLASFSSVEVLVKAKNTINSPFLKNLVKNSLSKVQPLHKVTVYPN